MTERRKDPEYRARIEELEHRVVRWTRGLLAMSTITLLACIAGLVAVKVVIDDVQANRREVIRSNCKDSKDRHDKTIEELDRRLSAAEETATPKQAVRLRASRSFTVALIDALSPARNCDELVRRVG